MKPLRDILGTIAGKLPGAQIVDLYLLHMGRYSLHQVGPFACRCTGQNPFAALLIWLFSNKLPERHASEASSQIRACEIIPSPLFLL